MFIVKKFGKRTVRKDFNTYEEARQYVRRLIRKKAKFSSTLFDFNYFLWRTPTIGHYGYTIHKV